MADVTDVHDRFDRLRAAINDVIADADGFDEETHSYALKVVDRLEVARLPVPKFWHHGGDAIVLEWDRHPTAVWMTICGSSTFVRRYPQR